MGETTMTKNIIMERLDEILTGLPQDDVAVQVSVRYAGLSELQQRILTTVNKLKQLRDELGISGGEAQ